MDTNYKNIAIAIKGNLLAEIKLENIHSEMERQLWNKAFEVGKEHPEQAENLLRQAQGEELKARTHADNVRHLRYALWNMLDILGVAYDSFHPELAEF